MSSSTRKKSNRFGKWKERWSSVREILENERIQAAFGVVLLVLAVFIGGALISGLFTGAADYASISEGLPEQTRPLREPYHNWLGGTGAFISFWLGRQGFGLGALAIPAILGWLGWPLVVQRADAKRGKRIRWAMAWMILTPWFVGYLATLLNKWGNGTWDHWIGATGHYVTDQSLIFLGLVGTGLVFAGFIAAVSAYQFQHLLKQMPAFSFRGILSWFASEDAEQQAWKNAQPADEDAAAWEDEGELPWNTDDEVDGELDYDESSDSILDELLDDIEDTTEDSDDNFTASGADVENDHEEENPVRNSETGSKASNDDVTFQVKIADDEAQLSEDEIDKKVQEFGEYDPTLDLSRFELPNLDLLIQHGDGKVKVSEEELDANKTRIIETLRNFSIEVSSITAEVGPTVTLYEIVPAPGIRISKIKNLEDDIALSLAALGIRIIAPIPGRGTIGIEVPNSNPDVVSMRSLIASDKFNNSKAALPIAIGKTISNETYVFDLAKMPHLLMAGATGQGKSVGLNAMLVSLLYRKHPSQLKFVLVDPKKVELTLFNHIERHYLAKLPDSEEAIITDTSKVVATLNSLCIEMDQRYDLLKEAQCRNIAEYNAKFVRRRLNPEEGHKYMPYIVLVVDEFADLIMTAGKEVETPIARLAQLARAIGIHLIIATQRPSVNIITGTIKANFPARIAFRVTSKIDSRTILDAGGADQLIGRGDMLMSTGNDLIRIQCGFVDTPEVEEICEFIGSQQGYPDAFMLPEYTDEGGGETGHLSDDERDDMFEDAARVIVMHQQGSTSLLQRKLKVGYNRAGRIIDQLEAAGIIGPFEGSKARKVLIPDEISLEQMLQKGDA